jgi:hypothetical protein
MLYLLIASAISGFCSKVVDEAIDLRLQVNSFALIAFSLIYGALIGWLASSTIFSSLFLAIAIASILAGKINHFYHLIGAVVFALVIAFFPLKYFDPWLFCLFLASGLFDELDIGGTRYKIISLFNSNRLWTPAAALLAVIFFNASILLLFGILVFDLFYRFGGWVVRLEYSKNAKKSNDKKERRKRK